MRSIGFNLHLKFANIVLIMEMLQEHVESIFTMKPNDESIVNIPKLVFEFVTGGL